ncbi:MAG TPA: hypothetical protein VGL93_16905 [Streptosporangiaceae bacterium]
MREAVVRVRVGADPDRALSAAEIADGVRELQAQGLSVRRRHGDGELSLGFDAASRDDARARAVSACEKAFGTVPAVGAVTFASRGTDEDALGVIEAFGVHADVERFWEDGEEVAAFTFPEAERRRVPESRLHTALEAALNCRVRIRYA